MWYLGLNFKLITFIYLGLGSTILGPSQYAIRDMLSSLFNSIAYYAIQRGWNLEVWNCFRLMSFIKNK